MAGNRLILGILQIKKSKEKLQKVEENINRLLKKKFFYTNVIKNKNVTSKIILKRII